jgi:hypothetical protein
MRYDLDIALSDPDIPHRWQALAHIMSQGAAGVIHPERRLAAGKRDFPHRDANPSRAIDINLGRVGESLAIVAPTASNDLRTLLEWFGTGRSGG